MARSPYFIPRSIAPGSPLARIGSALWVAHFHVLGHRDSWGSCAACQRLVLDTVPSAADLLRRGSAANGRWYWDKAVLDVLDADLWNAIVRRLPLRGALPIELVPQDDDADGDRPRWGALTSTDVAALARAFDGGRSLGLKGSVTWFRHQTGPGSAHEAVARPFERCGECASAAAAMARAIDYTLARHGPVSPDARLRLLADRTYSRKNLVHLVHDTARRMRLDDHLPAKAGSDLPNSVTTAIDAARDRPWPTPVYVAVLDAARHLVYDVDPDAPRGLVPWGAVAAQVWLESGVDHEAASRMMTAAEAEAAAAFVVEACEVGTAAGRDLDFHLPLRPAAAPLAVTWADGEVTELPLPDRPLVAHHPTTDAAIELLDAFARRGRAIGVEDAAEAVLTVLGSRQGIGALPLGALACSVSADTALVELVEDVHDRWVRRRRRTG